MGDKNIGALRRDRHRERRGGAVKSVSNLQALVKPYMHPSMYYKIGI